MARAESPLDGATDRATASATAGGCGAPPSEAIDRSTGATERLGRNAADDARLWAKRLGLALMTVSGLLIIVLLAAVWLLVWRPR